MSKVSTYKPLEIEVTDFGPIAKAKLDLRPLTVFVGPSNTGKSYLATLIYALHRFFGGFATESDPLPRSISGLFYQYPDLRRRQWNLSERDCSILLDWANQVLPSDRKEGFSANFHASLPDYVAALLYPMLRNVEEFSSDLDDEIARCFGSHEAARLIRIGKQVSRVKLKRHISDSLNSSRLFGYEFSLQDGDSILTASFPDNVPVHIERGDDDPLYQEKLKRLEMQIGTSSEVKEFNYRYAAQPLRDALVGFVGSSIISPLERVAYYLPAGRAGLMHSHTVVVTSLIQRSSRVMPHYEETSPLLSGVHSDFIEKLVTFRSSQERDRKSDRVLAKSLEEEILRGEVRGNSSPTGNPFYSYRPDGHKDEMLLNQASSMVSELAPVVLYLRHAVQPGDVLIIEEPESHLHPGMQAAFTRQLAAAVRAGVRVMLTTHSDYVLEELANLVRMSELPEERRADLKGAGQALSPDEVGVWLFEPGQQDEGSRVKEIPLDVDSGTFPAGYGAITEALYNTSVEIDSRIIESKNDQ